MNRSTALGWMLGTGLGLSTAFAQPQPAQPQQPQQAPQPPSSQPPPRAQEPRPQDPRAQQQRAHEQQLRQLQQAQQQQAAQQTTAAAAEAARADIRSTLGFVPRFLSELPDNALPGAWDEMKNLQLSPNTALPPKIKELIGLAVSAQVPCSYCTYAHTAFATVNGASEAETKEAVIQGSLTRHWSTVAQGQQLDLERFRRELNAVLAHVRRVNAGQAPAPRPMQITDANSALADIQQHLGSVPEFLRRLAPEALPGAWKEMRDVEMNPNSALSGKHKTLINIAVSSQIPCRYCLLWDTEFAKLEGASEREINEAIAMAAITRHWSTWLNGVQADEAQFKRDIDRLVRSARQQASAAANQPAIAKSAAQPAPAKPQPRPAASAKPAAQ